MATPEVHRRRSRPPPMSAGQHRPARTFLQDLLRNSPTFAGSVTASLQARERTHSSRSHGSAVAVHGASRLLGRTVQVLGASYGAGRGTSLHGPTRTLTKQPTLVSDRRSARPPVARGVGLASSGGQAKAGPGGGGEQLDVGVQRHPVIAERNAEQVGGHDRHALDVQAATVDVGAVDAPQRRQPGRCGQTGAALPPTPCRTPPLWPSTVPSRFRTPADTPAASGAHPGDAVARGTGRRVGGRWWGAASAGGRERAGRSGGRGAGRGRRSSPAW
jgi:hypothetical protein